MAVLLNENKGPSSHRHRCTHRYGCILSTIARNCFNFASRRCDRFFRSRAARNRCIAKHLWVPIRARQSHPASGSHDKSHISRGHESRRTSHHTPRLSSMRRRDARTDASIPILYQYASTRQGTSNLAPHRVDSWTAVRRRDQPGGAVVADQERRLPRRRSSHPRHAVIARRIQPGVAAFSAAFRLKQLPHGAGPPTAWIPAATASPTPGPSRLGTSDSRTALIPRGMGIWSRSASEAGIRRAGKGAMRLRT